VTEKLLRIFEKMRGKEKEDLSRRKMNERHTLTIRRGYLVCIREHAWICSKGEASYKDVWFPILQV
jgi:hypothetical protein